MHSLDQVRQLVSEVLILEKKWTGRSLERITTAICREMVRALKDESTRAHFAKEGWATLWFEKADVPAVSELPVGEVVLNIQEGDRLGVSGRFEYADDGHDQEQSAIVVMVRLPRDYDFQDFQLLVPDLKDALRHEIEHAVQSKETMVGLSGVLDPYVSMQSLTQYLLSKAETEAHVAGFYKKSKMLGQPASNVLDEELENIRNLAVREGLPEDEVAELLYQIKKQWLTNMKQRYPKMR